MRATFVQHPFGMLMPERSFSSTAYKYGYNGKEKLNEINVDCGDYDFDARVYDCRLGKWLSLDPKMNKYPHLSPYGFAANNPIIFVDQKGAEPVTAIIDAITAFLVEAGMSYVENVVFDGQSPTEALNNIKWGDAAVEGIKSYAVSLVFTGLGSTQALEKAATSKAGKITIEFVGNLTAEMVKMYNKGDLETDGSLDFGKVADALGDKVLPALVQALVAEGFDKKAEEIKGRLSKNMDAAQKEEKKLVENIESNAKGTGATKQTVAKRQEKVNTAQKEVVKSAVKVGAVNTAKETTKNVFGQATEAAQKTGWELYTESKR